MNTAQRVREAVRHYVGQNPREADTLALLLDLLAQGTDVLSPAEFRGHVAVGGVLINDSARILHIHHRSRDRWTLPGTHLRAEDDSLAGAARRCLVEATGFDTKAIALMDDHPLHVEVESVPESKGEPAHTHFDFRYLFRTASTAPFQPAEPTDLAWRPLFEMRDEEVAERAARSLYHNGALRA